MDIIDLHCAGCGAVTSIPPLCGPCFATIGGRAPIVASRRKGFDYIVRTTGGVADHMTHAQLAEFVANARWLEG